jgi:2-dehydro-3-deoxyphosphogluconate aldolase/(4S)-4-hydroxy-2-oxoglutarate aldolase
MMDAAGRAAIAGICAMAPVIPVIVIDRAADAVPLARTLVAAGLPVLEVTLRTPAALAAIAAMAAVPGAVVGAGTVLSGEDAAAAAASGARFAVSPGATPALVAGCAAAGLPLLPGAATASEAMVLAEAGFATLKFFPAEPAGGLAYLRALAGPLPQLRFCPTGGISAATAGDWLALPTVACVGASWVAPQAMIAAGDWAGIGARATAAAALRRPAAGQA